MSRSAKRSQARATRTAASMMRAHRAVRAGRKPGRTASEGQTLGERYSGKVSGVYSTDAVAAEEEVVVVEVVDVAAASREGST